MLNRSVCVHVKSIININQNTPFYQAKFNASFFLLTSKSNETAYSTLTLRLLFFITLTSLTTKTVEG